MLTFNPPILVTPPSYKGKSFPAIQVDELNYDVEYSDINKFASVRLVGFSIQLPLWSGAEYDAAGDFTTEDTDSRLLSILGTDPGAFISSKLSPRPSFRFGPTSKIE
jgi:hypothetical protein